MVNPGHFKLHSRAIPDLEAGDYTLEVKQRVAPIAGDELPTETYEGHLRVSSPRFELPPDQILSTFPPANSEGAYESRLPQIVLKRRTLPWERIVDSKDTKKPWLALVVIAEGEGTISGEVPVEQCFTQTNPPIKISGYRDVATSRYLSVPQSTVTKVFPTKGDLELLAHVREVDISDTELAMGDDDGFLAVVLANRLPQFDRTGCKPVRYMACLINLENQMGVLPPPTPPRPEFDPASVVFQLQENLAVTRIDPDQVHMTAGGRTAPAAATAAQPVSESADNTDRRSVPRQGTGAVDKPSGKTSNTWQSQPEQIENIAVSASAEEVSSVVREAMRGGFNFNFEAVVQQKMYRFPVLTHWSFTCAGAGSFETLMEGLDVGMLGTVAGRPSGKPKPDCHTPPGGVAPPDAPAARPAAELGETGHIGLPYTTRRGESVRAWYRGPLVPHLTRRQKLTGGDESALVHVSDQLRRLVPDGREDLGHAGAFEIGRLLALSRPSVMAALMRWRREQFGASRARMLADLILSNVGSANEVFSEVSSVDIATLGARVNRELILDAAKGDERVFANKRPVVDPGRPLAFANQEIGKVIAEGFNLEVAVVKQALKDGNPTILQSIEVPFEPSQQIPDKPTKHLEQALENVLENLVLDTALEITPELEKALIESGNIVVDKAVRKRDLTELGQLLNGFRKADGDIE